MSSPIKSIVNRVSRWPVLVVATLTFGLFLGIILPAQKKRVETYSNGAQSVDTSFFPTPDTIYRTAEKYGEAGRSQYIRDRLTFDVVWPLAYTLFFASLIGFCLRRVHGDKDVVYVLSSVSFFPMALDFLENTLAVAIMGCYPKRLAAIPWILALTTLLKWLAVGVVSVLATYAMLALPIAAIKRHRKSQ